MQNQSASILNGGMQATWYPSEHAEHSTIVAPSSGSRQVQKKRSTSVRLVLVVGFHARCLYGNMDKDFFSMQNTKWDRMCDWVKVTVTGSIPLQMLASKATASWLLLHITISKGNLFTRSLQEVCHKFLHTRWKGQMHGVIDINGIRWTIYCGNENPVVPFDINNLHKLGIRLTIHPIR